MQVMPDSELIVPVPAAERQAIEAFLAEHATAAAHEARRPEACRVLSGFAHSTRSLDR